MSHVQWVADSIKSSYQNAPRVLADVTRVTQEYKSLILKVTPQQSNGVTVNSIFLEGTVPTVYRGVTYHTPVQMWIPREYPNAPPLCYVIPNATLNLRKGVSYLSQSGNGQCLLQYLSSWNSSTHNLALAVEALKAAFSREPPLFARSAQSNAQTTTNSPATSTQPTTTHQPPTAKPTNYNQYQPTRTTSTSNGGAVVSPAVTHSGLPEEFSRGPAKEDLVAHATYKLQHELNQYFKRNNEDINTLIEFEGKLTKRASDIDTLITTQRAALSELTNTITEVDRTIKEQEEWLQQHEQQARTQANNIDEIVHIQNPLHQQYCEAKANEKAYNDLLYYLDKALARSGTTGLSTDLYLKYVRDLSRDQFQHMALSKKIEQLLATKAASQPPAYSAHASTSSRTAAAIGGGTAPQKQQQQPPAYTSNRYF